MTRCRWAPLAFLLFAGCSSDANSLSGSLGSLYDLSFTSVNLILQGSSISVQYVDGASGDPAVLIVDFKNIVNVAGSSIDLTQLDSGQPRGVLQRVGTVTMDFPIERGTVTFDQVPTVGSKLTGNFSVTASSPLGCTLDGDFSGTVTAP